MDSLPKKLSEKLARRSSENGLRQLGVYDNLVDFSSNDYLGFARSQELHKTSEQILDNSNFALNGATGSRLLTGNSKLYEETESFIARFHRADSALIFSSGYTANIGLLGSVPQRSDLILYDALVHASLREGIMLSKARSIKFEHNDLDMVRSLIERHQNKDQEIYIVTESVFSMDGDSPDLKGLAALVRQFGVRVILDEAHGVGITQKGYAVRSGIEEVVFARIVTFGKALGTHGAAVLGSSSLRDYLVNFARSFVYSTGLPPFSLAGILAGYHLLDSPFGEQRITELKSNIAIFQSLLKEYNLEDVFVYGGSPIFSMIIPENNRVKTAALALQNAGFLAQPILAPTVPHGEERLRLSVHSFNSKSEIQGLFDVLKSIS